MAVIKIILIGMKGCGKSTVGKLLAEKLNIQFIDLDDELEKIHFQTKKEKFSYREIYQKYGKEYFRKLETSALIRFAEASESINYILACGGGTLLNPANQKLLIKLGKIIYLKPDIKALLERVVTNGIPAFFSDSQNPKKSLTELLKIRDPIYSKLADVTLNCQTKMPREIITDIIKLL